MVTIGVIIQRWPEIWMNKLPGDDGATKLDVAVNGFMLCHVQICISLYIYVYIYICSIYLFIYIYIGTVYTVYIYIIFV